mgnify:CR=1 FL=1
MDLSRFYQSWDEITRLSQCNVQNARVTLDAISRLEQPVRICFEVVGPSALRITARKGDDVDGAARGVATEALLESATSAAAATAAAAAARESAAVDLGTTIRMDFGAYSLFIEKQPLRWWIADHEGRFVVGEGADDVNVAFRPRVMPIGPVTGSRTVEGRTLNSTGWRGSFRLAQDECIYGLGEHFTAMDRRGQHLESWNLDAYGTGSDRAYKSIPFFWSSRGYGVLFNTYCRVVHDVGNPAISSGSYVYSVDAAALDIVVFLGSPREVLAAYAGLVGPGVLPPYWVFGIWLSRCYYQSQAEAQEVAERMRAEHLPVDVLTMDGRAWLDVQTRCDFQWDRSKVPDPEELLHFLRDRHYRVCVWEYPYLSINSPAYAEAARQGYFMRDREGRPHIFQWAPEGFNQFLTLLPPSSIVDFTNPDAVEWYRTLHIPLLQSGVDVFKTDFGEQMPEDCFSLDGRAGRELHNELAILYNKTVYEVTRDYGKSGPVVFGRSGWAGSQKYPVQWGGDAHATWEGMAFSLRGGLGYCSSGIPLWTSDIGGFYGPKPDPELYIRWLEFGTFCPLMRLHGTTPREPWEFGDAALAIYRRYAALRYELLPYLYAAAAKATRTGVPVMRPLALDYAADPIARRIEDEYFLGESLIVAPMLTPGTKRTVYLPEGDWVDFWSGMPIEGCRAFEVNSPLDHIPVFARKGSVIPIGPALEYITSDLPDVAGIMVFGEGSGTLRVPGRVPGRVPDMGEPLELELRYQTEKGNLALDGTMAAKIREVRLIAAPPEGIRVLWITGKGESVKLAW